MSAAGTRPAGTPAGRGPSQRTRVLVYAGLAVLAVVVAVAGALVQAAWFPGGLLLALAGCLALFYGGAKASGTRVGVVVPAAVWVVCVMLLSTSRPEGDFLFAAGVGPYIYLLGGAMGAVICATVPQLPPGGRNRL